MNKWKKSILGKHIDLITGFPFKSEHYSDDESCMRLLRGDNVVQGDVRWDNVKKYPRALTKELDKYLLGVGDFVIAMDRTWVNAGLKAASISSNDVPSLLVQRVARLRVKQSLDSYFLTLLIRSHKFEQYVKGVQTETAVPHISTKQIREFPICLPSIEEQHNISRLLVYWDQVSKKTEQLISAKEKQFTALTQSLISQPCTVSDTLWPRTKVRELFKSVSTKKNNGEQLLSVTQDQGVIPRDMRKGRVMSPAGSVDGYKLVEPGNFVISLRSFQGGLEYSAYRGIVSPAYTVLTNNKPICAGFYKHFFKSYIFVEKYLRAAVIGIRDGKQVSFPDFESVKIPYPPLEEQKKIAEILNTARAEIKLLKQQAALYRKQKRGLMQKLLTGEWRVNRLEKNNQEVEKC